MTGEKFRKQVNKELRAAVGMTCMAAVGYVGLKYNIPHLVDSNSIHSFREALETTFLVIPTKLAELGGILVGVPAAIGYLGVASLRTAKYGLSQLVNNKPVAEVSFI